MAESISTPPPATGGGQPQGADGLLGAVFPFLAMGIVFWLFFIRPQSRERKKKEAMLAAMKVKDKVATIGGLVATIAEIDGDEVVLLADPKKDVKIRYRRDAISAVLSDETK